MRAASGVARYGAGWLVVQDDATHACVWESGSGRALRLVAPVEGHDTFEEASGTKALKPDLEAVVALPDGRTLALGSGSTPARMRCVLLSESTVQVAGLAPIYARVAELLEVPADQLNLEGAAVVGGLAALVPARAAVRRRTERQRRRRAGRPPRPCVAALRPRSGSRVCAATTSARWPASGSRSPTRSACRAASCWSAPRRRTRPRRTTTAPWSAPPSPCSTASACSTWPSSRCWTARWPSSRGWPSSGTATTCSTWSRSSTPTTRRCRRCCWSWWSSAGR